MTNPRFSVVITTFNRMRTLPRAIESVLFQDGPTFELIVVDDGSGDETGAYLNGLLHQRLRVVRQDNRGACAARNAGLKYARGEWTVFLDDDDVALPAWLKTFDRMITQTTGIVCCGGAFFYVDGSHESTVVPWEMGAAYGHRVGSYLVGTFAARTQLLVDIGGLDEQMESYEQGELWLRLIPELARRGMEMETTDQVLVHFERRGPTDRPMSSPEARYRGIQRLLTKHPRAFDEDNKVKADIYGVLGVSAARLGRWREARKALVKSATADAASLKRWGRVILSMAPPVARLVWRPDRYDVGDVVTGSRVP